MTVIVSVKINDGIVMAADSVSSFGPVPLTDGSGRTFHQNYSHANKIVNLRKDLPIGAMVTGSGNIGAESIETLLKDLRRRFCGEESQHADWQLNRDTYTMENVAQRLRQFLFEEKAAAAQTKPYLRVRICGYGSGRALPEVWEVVLLGPDCPDPKLIQGEDKVGIRWDGEYEPLNRLIAGISGRMERVIIDKLGGKKADFDAAFPILRDELMADFVVASMPIQDAIDLGYFLVDTTINYVKFDILSPKTVGGPIEIAAITKHEGFKWVLRKHFFDAEHNPPSPTVADRAASARSRSTKSQKRTA